MILQYLDLLNSLRIVLASGSKWRRKALADIGLSHLEIHVSDFAEDLDKTQFENGGAYALATARQKAHSVHHALSQPPQSGEELPVDVLLAADTVAAFPPEPATGAPLLIIEKASDADHARQILRTLSGKQHEVWTGVVLGHRSHSANTPGKWIWKEFTVLTKVSIAPLSESFIDAYVVSGAWRGKAGAYGLQDLAGCFVERLEGDSFNVIGIPLQRVCLELAQLVDSGELQ